MTENVQGITPRHEPKPEDRFSRAVSLLEDLFGFTCFRPGQDEVVRSVLSGRDTLAVMPTGGGKSLCYQIPALISEGPTVVVSPLVSLMADQVASLSRVFESQDKASGEARSEEAPVATPVAAPVATLHSSMGASEQRRVEGRLLDGSLKVLLAAPERFRSLEFVLLLKRARPARFVIDEAHCVSEWGHSFRPEYLYLRRVMEDLGGSNGTNGSNHTQIVALTATADPRVRQDIVELLGMKDPEVLVHGFDRPNLSYEVRQVTDSQNSSASGLPASGLPRRYETVKRALREGRTPAVVYAHTRRQCETLAAYLTRGGIEAASYHAGMPVADRDAVQGRFMDGTLPVVVATVAFGMGVDKPNIRQVIHAYIPSSIPAYVQESGRAGRDGRQSECLVLYSAPEVEKRKDLTRKTGNQPTAEDARVLFDALKARAGKTDSGRILLSSRQVQEVSGLTAEAASEVLRALEAIGAIERRYNLWNEASIEIFVASAKASAKATLSPAVKKTLEAAGRLAKGRPRLRVGLPDLARQARLSPPVVQGSLMSLASLGLVNVTGQGTLQDLAVRVKTLSEKDLRMLENRFEHRSRLDALHIDHVDDYLSTDGCRRKRLLDYFGDEQAHLIAPCGGCDVCRSPVNPARSKPPKGQKRLRQNRPLVNSTGEASAKSANIPADSIDLIGLSAVALGRFWHWMNRFQYSRINKTGGGR